CSGGVLAQPVSSHTVELFTQSCSADAILQFVRGDPRIVRRPAFAGPRYSGYWIATFLVAWCHHHVAVGGDGCAQPAQYRQEHREPCGPCWVDLCVLGLPHRVARLGPELRRTDCLRNIYSCLAHDGPGASYRGRGTHCLQWAHGAAGPDTYRIPSVRLGDQPDTFGHLWRYQYFCPGDVADF